ncbi:histidine phosphatase family protein [Aliiruegeria sabulilitoris]|uniref:histidine phosphatase family protein n=1 Tax=Aliiruegeria sabulilitoris TaxID=1510458 RepID=UPI0008346C84|nr:histidine phosphatase family protein [Aliiruegeria sabulilitoris]NDR55920.1 histidine phosphatase family protein [Pseudoruegeria sp. M32A2M]
MVNWWWVRHGPTHRRDMNGWTDVPADLSDTAALERLRDYLPADAPVVSSDLTRAIKTADAIQASRPRLPHERGLREIHFGAWEARTFDEVQEEDPRLIRRYWEQPGDVKPPGGESWHELSARVNRAVDWLTGEAGDIIAVAHFGTILSQLQRARGCTAVEVLEQRIDNLSVTRVTWDGRSWAPRETNHIPE